MSEKCPPSPGAILFSACLLGVAAPCLVNKVLCVQVDFSVPRGQVLCWDSRPGRGELCLCHHLLDPHRVRGAVPVPTVYSLHQPSELAGEGFVDVTVEQRRHGAA